MARYQCGICGYIFDEERKGSSFQSWKNVRCAGIPRITYVCWRSSLRLCRKRKLRKLARRQA